MFHHRFTSLLLVVLATLLTPASVHASFHLWKVQEVFTNADGSVQFIELFDNNLNEQFVAGHQLKATSDGVTKTFTFPGNLSPPPDTTGRTMLIATPGFAALTGGVTPDFTLPDPAVFGPFFNPAATNISINFDNLDSISFTGAFLPRDGVNSITDTTPTGVPTLVVGPNSPTHFELDPPVSGAVNVPPSGDYNKNGSVDAADYVRWRKTLTQSVITGQGADGNVNGTIDDADYTHWRVRFGNTAIVVAPGAGSAAAVPEPITPVLMSMGLCVLALRRRR